MKAKEFIETEGFEDICLMINLNPDAVKEGVKNGEIDLKTLNKRNQGGYIGLIGAMIQQIYYDYLGGIN